MKNEYRDKIRDGNSYCLRISTKNGEDLQKFAQTLQLDLFKGGFLSSISAPRQSNYDSLWYCFLDAKKKMTEDEKDDSV